MRAQDARGARFEGCDAPIGIPEPQRPIFSERLQVQTPATVARSGDGPGLSIVSRILNPYPLKLEVESTPGVGSRFRLASPAGAAGGEA